MTTPFAGKSIFVWENEAILNNQPNLIAQKLANAGFETVYLHITDGLYIPWVGYPAVRNGRPNRVNIDLVSALKARGLHVYGWGAVYNADLVRQAQLAAQRCAELGLDGHIFDAEGDFEEPAQGANSRAVRLIMEFKKISTLPVAWCWWSHYQPPSGSGTWHPKDILRAVMEIADAGIIMAYWSWGDAEKDVLRYLNTSLDQWEVYTKGKPIIAAGRAYVGDGGTPTTASIAAFHNLAVARGCAGVSWWSLEHALKLPDIWAALSALPGFKTEQPPVVIPQPEPEPENPVITNGIQMRIICPWSLRLRNKPGTVGTNLIRWLQPGDEFIVQDIAYATNGAWVYNGEGWACAEDSSTAYMEPIAA
jgi:hypothetical protein